jgi:hypothetical protein
MKLVYNPREKKNHNSQINLIINKKIKKIKKIRSL